MNLQVLVSTMNQDDHSILEKMNIQSDAIIINQCDKNYIEKLKYKGNNIGFLSFNERGVGLSRNNALMRAEGDISLFADEDLIYVDGYENLIINEFIRNPKADMILFNVPSTNPNRPTYQIHKESRVRWFNSLRYGAVKIAVRTEKIKKANIYFSLLFGGGAKYSAGEDSLFIIECLRKGLKIYANPKIIGYVRQDESTWFNGHTDKYFYDKGAWLANAFPKLKSFFAIYYAVKFKKITNKNFKSIYSLIIAGFKDFNERI